MKKIVFGLVGLFIASQLLVSCSSENTMLSQFSKRKYLKKFKEKNVKYEDKVGELETEVAYEVKQQEVITASVKEEISPVKVQEEKTLEVATLTTEQQEQITKVKTLVNDYSDWNKYNRTTDFSSINMDYNTINNSSSFQNNVSPVVLVILCILIPPLAVYLFEDSITNNFWIDLILTLLFWFPGMIFAFLVCFAGVSV